MTFCPNKSLPEWKSLEEAQPERAYKLWNKYKGEVPSKYYYPKTNDRQEKATAYLSKLFPGKETVFYDFAKEIGNKTQHGYVENGAINMWTSAETGTEYHEAYHLLFRTMLSEEQRQSLYKDAAKEFGKPTTAEIEKIKKEVVDLYNIAIGDEEASNLVLEEKMADGFMEHMLTEEESSRGIVASIAKWFRDLFSWIKGLISNKIGLRDVYSLMETTKSNETFLGRGVFRNPEAMQSSYNPSRLVEGIPSATVDKMVEGLTNMVINEIDAWETPLVGEILGTKNTRGKVVNGLLYQIYKYLDKRPMDPKKDIPIFMKGLTMEILFENATRKYTALLKTNKKEAAAFKPEVEKLLKDFTDYRESKGFTLNNFRKVATDASPRDKALAATLNNKRKLIKHVVLNWNGKKDSATGNTTVPSWKQMIVDELRANQYNIVKDSIASTNEEGDAEADMIEAMESGVEDKDIKGRSHFADSPMTKVSEKAKAILRRIPKVEATFDKANKKIIYKQVTNDIFTDQTEYWSLRYVYKQLSELWADVGSFQEMEEKLIEASKYRPDYSSINQRIMSMPGNERALLYKTFAQTLAEFNMAILGSQGKVLNANSSTTEQKAVKQWTGQMVEINGQEEGEEGSSRAVFAKTLSEEDDEASGFVVKTAKFNKIKEAFKKAYGFNRMQFKPNEDPNAEFFNKEPVIDSPAWALGSLIWELGFNFGSNVNQMDTIINVQNLINKGFKISKTEAGKVKNHTVIGKEAFDAIFERARLSKMVEAIANVSTSREGVGIESKKEKPVLYFNTEKQGMKFLAGLAPLFTSRVAESFVTPTGSAMYPVNMATTLSELPFQIRKDVTANKEQALPLYRKDKFIFPPDMMPSHLFFHLTQNEEFLRDFKTSPLAGIRDYGDDALDYEDFNNVDSVLTRLEIYNNNFNEKYYYVAVPAQADRARFDMMLMPRIKGHFDTKFNKKNGVSDVFRDAILQDLLRIKQARATIAASKEDPNVTLIPDYHTGQMRGLSDEFMQFDGIDELGNRIVTDRAINSSIGVMRMSDLAEEFIRKTKSNLPLSQELQQFRNELTEMISGLSLFYTGQAKQMAATIEEADRKNDVNSKLLKKWADIAGVDLSKRKKDEQGNSPFVQAMIPLLKDFLIHEDLGRNEIIKLTRGNRALFKNIEDFTKRQRLLTTPRTKLAEKNTLAKKDGLGNYVPWMDERYGAISEYNEMVFDDPMGQVTAAIATEMNNWANRTKEMLLKSGYTAAEAAFTDEYKAGSFEEHDGLTLISIDWLREIMQGEGEWFQYHEVAYNNYKNDPEGKFVYPAGVKDLPRGAKVGQDIPIRPYKPFGQEVKSIGGTVAVDLTKTAYFPLLKSYTKAFPVMDDMRMRMEANPNEANNPYAGMKKIHTASAVSAKKGVQLNVFNMKGWSRIQGGFFRNVKINRNSTSALGFPQTVPAAKEYSETILGRQIKKNAIANVKSTELYYYNAGIAGETAIPGADMTALYHAAIEERLRRDLESVNNEIGLSEFRKVVNKLKSEKPNVDSIKGAQEFKEAKARLLKNIRNLIEEQAIERELSDNFIKALDITIDPVTGIARFAIPMDFPVYGTAFQSALLSVYNNRVFKQYVPGYEAVQTAALGGFEVDRSLKFLEVVDHPTNKRRGTRLAHAEIMIREDVLRKFGIEPGADLDANNIPEELRRIIGYRIPNQDKASTIIFKIKSVLPAGYEKAIVVPPQLVKLMGSDFDVDKMFLLFPELNEDGTKVRPDYKTLAKTKDVSKISDKELTNIVLDTIEAVFSSPEHYLETLRPLDNEVLKNIRTSIIELNRELAPSKVFTGGMYETTSAVRNMLGNKMRGLWANALAGRNIATVSDNFNLKSEFAVKIAGEMINTKMQEIIPASSGFAYDAGEPTDKIMSRYLNAAVDATKAPYHYIVNDNAVTFPVELLWIQYYGDTELLHHFLNQPIIRDFVDTMAIKFNDDLSKINEAYKEVADKNGITLGSEDLPTNYKNISETTAMTRQSIMTLTVNKERALQNFLKMYTAGSQLKEAFRLISPDTTSGINRLEAIQEHMGKKKKFDNPKGGKLNNAPIAFYGRGKDENVLTQFFDENSIYGFERGYDNLLSEMAGVSSVLFPMTTSESSLKFKEAIRTAASLDAMTTDHHRDVNAAIMFTILTKEESPIAQYMNVEYSERLYKPGYIDPATIDPKTKKGKPALTLWKRIEEAASKFGNLTGNEFLMKLTEDENNSKFKNFKTFNFDATQQFSREEKSRIQDDLHNLLYKPEAYVKKTDNLEEYKKNVEKIRQIGFDLCMHALISNGFRKSAFNYVSMIPPQFWLNPMSREVNTAITGKTLKPISVADYMHGESAKMQTGKYFDAEDLARFFRVYGEIRPGGRNLLQRHSLGPEYTKLEKVHKISNKKFGGNQEAPGVMVFRTSKGESGVYVKANPTETTDKTVYLSMFGTTNNKKHIVGGDWLNKRTFGDSTENANNIMSMLQAYYDATSTKVAQSDVTQICML
jgi:hypothetical protein